MPFHEGFVTAYLDPLQVRARFAQLPVDYPSLCALEVLPLETHGYFGAHTPAHGRQKMLALTIRSQHGPAERPAVLLMRSPHAREWINGMAVVEAALQFLDNYRPADMDPRVQQIVTMLDSVEIVIVPEGNPDGALYSFFDPGQRMWRKNLRPASSGGTCAGVDCNRNYSRYFGDPGSSGAPCSDVYHGPSAFSEPESANIANLVAARRNIVFAIDSHSYGQAIFRPHPNGGTYISSLPVPVADHAIYTQLEAEMNSWINSVNGTTYSTGTTSNHAGASDEYLFFEQFVYGFDLECGLDFQPDEAEAVIAAKEVVAATQALAWCAAGQTGLDVAAMLARRVGLDAAPRRMARLAEAPWRPVRTPPERCRRLLCTCETPADQSPATFVADLLERGFDVLCDHVTSGGIDVVLSAEELVTLLRESLQVSIHKDVYATGDTHRAGD